MGKNRGIKPQGMVNPMLMAKRTMPSGPSIQERLNRSSRPTWEDIKKIANKKQKSSSEFLEAWENNHFREELTKFREKKRSSQEKQQLRRLKKEAKNERKRNDNNRSDDDDEIIDKHNNRSSKSSQTTKKKRRKKNDDDTPINPHKLSQLFARGLEEDN